MKVMLIQTLYLNFLMFLLNWTHQFCFLTSNSFCFHSLVDIFSSSANINMQLSNVLNAGAGIIMKIISVFFRDYDGF